jgi:hypothetical protein
MPLKSKHTAHHRQHRHQTHTPTCDPHSLGPTRRGRHRHLLRPTRRPRTCARIRKRRLKSRRHRHSIRGSQDGDAEVAARARGAGGRRVGYVGEGWCRR